MSWGKVGEFLKDNGGGLIKVAGSVLGGPIGAGVAAVASLVSEVTGETEPEKALAKLKADPETMVRLEKLANQEKANIREYNRAVLEAQLKDKQAEHHETQETIRSGDKADDRFVRWTRPGQSWLSLIAGIVYAFMADEPSEIVLIVLFTLPFAYAGLRQIGKGVDAVTAVKAISRGK